MLYHINLNIYTYIYVFKQYIKYAQGLTKMCKYLVIQTVKKLSRGPLQLLLSCPLSLLSPVPASSCELSTPAAVRSPLL